MECNPRIKPLIKDINHLYPKSYLKSSAYNRYLISNGKEHLWKQCYDYSVKQTSIYCFDVDMEGMYCEDALNILLNHFYKQTDNNYFFRFIIEFLEGFKKFKKDPIDLSEIIADIEILSPPEGTLERLHEIGNDYVQPSPSIPIEKEEIPSPSDAKVMPKVFISHATKDVHYVERIVSLLEHMGLQKEHIFCSSIPEYGIPMGEDIYGYLKSQFKENDLYVIFVLSDNYYGSAACLNEMGAAWVLQSSYQTLLLPGFQFEKIKGAINAGQLSYHLDNKVERRARTNQLKDCILNYLGIELPNHEIWERHRDNFFAEIDRITPP